MKIGIFDSGLGGLTVVRRLRERLPKADLLFFSDQVHLPYGDRGPEELHRLLVQNLKLLEQAQVDAIAMGCNTSCAVAMNMGWPQMSIPVFDLIEAGANLIFASCYLSTGVVATAATVQSAAYQKYIQKRHGAIEVCEIAAPRLVPLIERGASRQELYTEVHSVLERFPIHLQSLILGCSHYPLILDIFAEVAPHVAILDPSLAQADVLAAFARREGREDEGYGTIRAWTSGDPERFEHAVASLGQLPGMTFGVPNGMFLR